ncbi:hypothetical protein [Georgenia sp. SUBG003]|uniref:hypothetical protein n=1 Tax=Georgenia sp. SUBG003 TaxID=1497974 RepID=UPI003AB82D80
MDASINIMRRSSRTGARGDPPRGTTARSRTWCAPRCRRNADAVALSSYQGRARGVLPLHGGHARRARRRARARLRRGRGTITHEEIAELEAYGVERIYHPDDGMRLGLTGMVDDVVARAARHRAAVRSSVPPPDPTAVAGEDAAVGRVLSAIEDGAWDGAELARHREAWETRAAGVVPVGLG